MAGIKKRCPPRSSELVDCRHRGSGLCRHGRQLYPQPAAHRQLVGQPDTAAARLAAKERQAESEAAEAVAVYERMSDQERMRGVVLEPVEE